MKLALVRKYTLGLFVAEAMLLFSTLMFLWIRSYAVPDGVEWSDGMDSYGASFPSRPITFHGYSIPLERGEIEFQKSVKVDFWGSGPPEFGPMTFKRNQSFSLRPRSLQMYGYAPQLIRRELFGFRRELFGFGYSSFDEDTRGARFIPTYVRYRSFYFPMAALEIPLALLSARWTIRWWRRRSQKALRGFPVIQKPHAEIILR